MLNLTLNIGYILPIITFWQRIYFEISKYIPEQAITNNIVSSIHCVSYILHYNYDYNIDYYIHLSIGYYIYDTLYILSRFISDYKQQSKEYINFVYITHHLSGVYILYEILTGDNKDFLLKGYNLTEVSNIMLYISFHINNVYAHHVYLNILTDFIHLLWFSYIRVFILSAFMYNSLYSLQFSTSTRVILSIIYSIGLCWCCLLVKRNMTNLHTLIKSKDD
jgi:hypothetical protein